MHLDLGDKFGDSFDKTEILENTRNMAISLLKRKYQEPSREVYVKSHPVGKGINTKRSSSDPVSLRRFVLSGS
ncbi:hypothetical protein AVEN_168275-1, partial [Araneus ventricosus]